MSPSARPQHRWILALLAAVWLITSGFAHFYDAINIYNDGLPPAPAP